MGFVNPVDWFAGVPHEWAVFLMSMIPVTELRAAVPIGLEVYDLSVWKVWLFAVLGNMLPTIFILLLMPYLHDWFLKQPFIGNVLKKKLSDAERLFAGKHAKYGALALVLFVGIPLPFTGAWTGSLASFIFKIEFKKAFPMIFVGVCIAATIMTIITLFAGGALRAFI